jgi:DNA-binding NarL/FixJ family response regulator
MDLNMPGVDGAESIATLCDLAPDAKVVVLSASEDRLDVLDVLSAGIDGYIRKSLPSAEIVQSLRDVLDGRVCVPVSLMRRHGRNGASLTETRDGAGLSSMTARQRDVLEHLMLGKSSKEIGRALGLAEGTVKIHLSAIYRALGARSRGEAIAKVAGAR